MMTIETRPLTGDELSSLTEYEKEMQSEGVPSIIKAVNDRAALAAKARQRTLGLADDKN